jgi:G3E family GTPase
MPFHPARLHNLIYKSEDFKSVIRSKGIAWLLTRNDHMMVWGHAGRHYTFTKGMPWFATVPFDKWTLVEHSEVKKMLALMDPVWGDRRQELVIIGQNMATEKVSSALTAALVTSEELAGGAAKLGNVIDPFPEWEEKAEEEEDDDAEANEWIL